MGERGIAVHCDKHGTGYAAFVCRHLLHGSGRGFFCSDNGPCPDAWCAACDALMMQTGHWTEEAEKFAGIRVVCNRCYRNIRRRNLVRSPGDGRG
jgi:hypothetical protein